MNKPGIYPTRRAAARALAPVVIVWAAIIAVIAKACT